ncbi:MAG: hypothetical protein AAFO04_29060 [Cyanobacteria bacterium J06592_8]
MVNSSTNQGFGLRPSSKRNLCPICGKDHGCKISDNLILCLRGDRNFLVPGWKWIKEAANGMGGVFVADNGTESTFDREEWQRKQAQLKEAERKRTANSLSEESRSRHARQIIKQLGLSTKHRQNLRERGLTDEQIEEIGFKSVEASQRLIIPISPDFPGVNVTGDQLKNADGYLVPLFNEQGQIIGFQIAADDRNRAKYLWLSENSDFRLPSGEPPLTVRQVEGDCAERMGVANRDVRLCEGTLKPLIASYRHNKTFIGAAGGNFSASPELLKRYLDALIKPGGRVILDSDAGIGTNRHVQQRDLATIALVESFGYEVAIEWWGQFEKTPNNDIDEIKDLKAAKLLTPDEFKKILGVDEIPSHQPKRSGVISKEEWWEKFGLPRQEQKNESQLLAAVERLFRIGKKRKEKAIAIETDFLKNLVKLSEDGPKEIGKNITYSPNSLPDPIEWWRQGEPELTFEPDQTKQIVREAKDRGFKHVLDGSYTGAGKTHRYGELTCEDLGIKRTAETEEEKKELGRAIWISESPRNPSTSTVEENYKVPLVKHNGLVEDPTRQTPSGRRHLKRSTEIEHDAITSQVLADGPSCINSAVFQAAAERGYILRAGKKSPLCKACENFEICPIINSEPDCDPYLSYHPKALHEPRPNDSAFWDEARLLLKATNSFIAYRSDIERANTHIERKASAAGDDKTHKLAKIFIHSLLDGMDEFTPDNKKWGANHRESVNKIILKPLIGESTEVWAAVPYGTEGAIAIEDDWADPVFEEHSGFEIPNTSPKRLPRAEGVPVRWYKPTTVSDVKDRVELATGEIIWVDSLNFRTQLSHQTFVDQVWELYGDDWVELQDNFEESWSVDPLNCTETFVQKRVHIWGVFKKVRTTDREGHQRDTTSTNPIVPSINDLKSQLNHYLHSKDEQLFTLQQSPTEKYQSVLNKVLYNWLNPLLSILSPSESAESAHLKASSTCLTVTRPSSRQSNTAKRFQFNVYLDATVDQRDLSDLLKLRNTDSELDQLNEELVFIQKLCWGVASELNQLKQFSYYLLALGNSSLTFIGWHQLFFGVMRLIKLSEEQRFRLEEAQSSIEDEMRSLIRENKILKIELARPQYSNLQTNTYSNLGRVTRNRFCRDKLTGQFNILSRYASGNRVQRLTTQIIDQALAEGKTVGIIDSKAYIQGIEIDGTVFSPYAKYKDNPQVKMGWWFNDHVGSNRFEKVDVLLLVGKPQINLGQLAAEWQCRTGQIVDPANPTGKFAAYVQRVMLGELEQALGRPRAHRRPDEQIEIHLIDDYSPDELAFLEAKFPGMGLQLNRTEDVCVEAATKGTQLTARFDAIIKNLIAEGGPRLAPDFQSGEPVTQIGDIAKTTAASIGKSLGVTHGRISQMIKERWGMGFREFKRLLISLLDLNNRKTNGFDDLCEDEKWIAEWYLPHLVEGWREGNLEVDMVDEFVSLFESFGAKAFRRIIEGSPPDAIAILTQNLLETLPPPFLVGLKQ